MKKRKLTERQLDDLEEEGLAPSDLPTNAEMQEFRRFSKRVDAGTEPLFYLKFPDE